jgi:threonyl-tRNA synthetase
MPQRFGLTYIDADGSRKRRYDSSCNRWFADRFLGILIEHYGGAFPTWLAPVQAQVVTVSEKFNAYGQKVQQALAVGRFTR